MDRIKIFKILNILPILGILIQTKHDKDTTMTTGELPIIQKTYDLVLWYIPHVNKMPRDHRFGLGDRIAATLYGLLEGFIRARYSREKQDLLRDLNTEIEILRFQTRLMKDFQVFSNRQYEFASSHLNEIGSMLGGWLRSREKQR